PGKAIVAWDPTRSASASRKSLGSRGEGPQRWRNASSEDRSKSGRCRTVAVDLRAGGRLGLVGDGCGRGGVARAKDDAACEDHEEDEQGVVANVGDGAHGLTLRRGR